MPLSLCLLDLPHAMRKSSIASAVLACLPLMLVACGGDNAPSKSVLAVIGDAPYGTTAADTSQFQANPAFINAINSDPDVSLVMHAGDIHSGKQYCTQAYDAAIFSQWQAFKRPLVYTPGDNEWTDCHKAGEGGGTYNVTSGTVDFVKDGAGNPVDYKGGDPVENLKLVRQIFFATPGQTLGAGGMGVVSQATAFDARFPADKEYVENVQFEKSGVMFVTMNVPGGSNNDTDPWYGSPAMGASQQQEVANRSAADLRWLASAFMAAAANGDTAIVIMLQADMWDLDGKAASHIAQYKQFVDAIASNTKTFGKPVLLINGDSHVYRSDNPLKAGQSCVTESGAGVQTAACKDDAYANQPNGYDVPNFHRIVVHGSTAPLEWLKLTVDPGTSAANTANAFGPFSWTRVQP
jgi:hypothetical protein